MLAQSVCFQDQFVPLILHPHKHIYCDSIMHYTWKRLINPGKLVAVGGLARVDLAAERVLHK
jgi:hypothetical protein